MSATITEHTHCGPLVGAIDEGTTSVRFLVFSSNGQVLASHQIEVPSTYPDVGWVEQDPKFIMKAVVECMEETMKKLESFGITASEIVSVGVTNQRETTVLWDRLTGEPLYNAIIWMDNRTQAMINTLLESKPNKDVNQLRDITGLPINPYFSAMKFRWLIDNVSEVGKAIRDKRCLFGTIDSWLIWNLTGGRENGIHVTDVTNASRTLLMNLDTLQWDPLLTEFFDIPSETLPEIRSSSEIYGNLKISPLKDVPLAGCVGDQHAALIGQLCFHDGDTKCTYGTGCFILTNTGLKKIKSKHGLLTTVAYKLGKDAEPVYALEGSIASGGSTLTWLRDNLLMVEDVGEIDTLANQLNDSFGIYFVPAFQGLYAPYWEPEARGLICGLTMETTRKHIARAAIEGIAYQVAAILESVAKDNETDVKLLKVDGGLCKNETLLQFQADICGLQIAKQEMMESTAFGAAVAAGLALGINLADAEKLEMKYFKPSFTKEESKKRMKNWMKAVQRSVMSLDHVGKTVSTTEE